MSELNKDLDAERSVLAAMMLEPEAAQSALDSLSVNDFWSDSNKAVFKAISAMHHAGIAVDLVTLSDMLRKSGDLEAIGGASYLMHLMDAAVTAKNVGQHVGIVREKSTVRMLETAAIRMSRQLKSGAQCDEVIAAIKADLEAAGSRVKGREPEHIGESLAELFTGKKDHIPFGLEPLERLKVVPGNLCVVGARPGSGKTAMLGTIALNAARRGWECLFLSLEMPSVQIRQRMIAADAGIDLPTVEAAEDPKVLTGAKNLAALPIWIEDASLRLDVETISRLVRRFVADRPGRNTFVVVDYLQLIGSKMKHDKRYELIGHVCRELKRLAMAAKVPMVVAAQLSRNAENRGKDSKPQLSDLRESGEIEQTADQVLLLHREADRTLVRVAKYRMGPMFTADLRFVGERCYFDDYGGWR